MQNIRLYICGQMVSSRITYMYQYTNHYLGALFRLIFRFSRGFLQGQWNLIIKRAKWFLNQRGRSQEVDDFILWQPYLRYIIFVLVRVPRHYAIDYNNDHVTYWNKPIFKILFHFITLFASIFFLEILKVNKSIPKHKKDRDICITIYKCRLY